MKKEYNIKDRVWIHLGESKLVGGRVVDIFDLAHIDGYPADREFYVIEIQTGIDNIFEVRDFDQISPDSTGPINAYRKLDANSASRYLKKIGIKLPESATLQDYSSEDLDEPTADQIHAAIEKSQKDTSHAPLIIKEAKPKPKRRQFVKRKPKE
jgi:hypothetical protein